MGARVLIVGSGGREDALVWKLAQSPRVEKIFACPGHGRMVPRHKTEYIPIDPLDLARLVVFAKNEGVDLIVPGPEAPIVAGLADEAERAGIFAAAPSGKAAMATEGSKCDAKEFMRKYEILTARFQCFKPGEWLRATSYIMTQTLPLVVKDDRLAGGKGVTIAKTDAEAFAAAAKLFSQGARLVVEEFLDGYELTFMCAVSGEEVLPLAVAQDHKLLNGKMTGGMASVSDDSLMDEVLRQRIMNRIVRPTVRGLVQEGKPYRGILYIGLMVVAGNPYVLEFNCRFGDPEAQVVLRRLQSDLFEVFEAMRHGYLGALNIGWDPRPAVCIVLASAGYPGTPLTGDLISGVEDAERMEGIEIFYAGTKVEGDKLVTAGGRVLGVTAIGRTFAEAVGHAYAAVAKIHWKGMQYLKEVTLIRR